MQAPFEIVWFDPNVNNIENASYQSKYLKGRYNYYCIEDHKSAIIKIDQLLAYSIKVLVISCGSKGEQLCKDLQNRKI